MDRRHSYPHTQETFLPISGEYHFATSQPGTNFIAYYIKKIAAIRLAVDATDSSLTTLTPIDPTTTGWLAGVYIIHAASDEFAKSLKVIVNN